MAGKRPSFSGQKASQPHESPVELFNKLPNRAKSHGYLRAEQSDALKLYKKHVSARDIALELPTGTGKTTVGLLISEWRRRKSPGSRVAYLTLTNQLAGQVLAEAENLGLPCADIRGSKETRDKSFSAPASQSHHHQEAPSKQAPHASRPRRTRANPRGERRGELRRYPPRSGRFTGARVICAQPSRYG